MPEREVKIQEFAAKVERICDFVIAKLRNEGVSGDSADARVILDLKEEAADIATGNVKITEDMFTGLDAYMRGL